MILHIFKKDARRLWPFAAALAIVAFYAAIAFKAEAGHPDHRAAWQFGSVFLGGNIILHHTLPVITGLGVLTFLLIVLLVQLDPLTGDRQDWLTRPIQRHDLLLAKLLFVIVLVHGPVLAVDLVQRQTLAAALAHNLSLFVSLSLPAMAIGAMTRTIGHALGLALAAFAGALAIAYLSLAAAAFLGIAEAHNTLAGTIIVLAGAGMIMGLQYFRRATGQSQAVLAVTAALATAAPIFF